MFVGWLLNVPATCKCISGTDLLRQLYVLPHWDRSCRSNFLSHPITVYWHRAGIFRSRGGRLTTRPTRRSTRGNRLVGLVVKASASRAADPGFVSRLRRDFPVSSHTSDFKIGTPVTTPTGAWRYRVSAGTGFPGVSILWLGEVESLIFNFYLRRG